MNANGTLDALNLEWTDLVTSHPHLVKRWTLRQPELVSASNLDEILELVPRSPDAVFGALLRLGAQGEALAYRTVLQAMLGKVVLLSAGRPDLFGEGVSELWLAIADYPLERRPRSIAANLSWTLRRRLYRPSPKPLAPPEPPAGPTASDTLAEARQLGLIGEVAFKILWLVYVDGLTSSAAATRLGTTPEAVRYHCSRNLRRLARKADLLAS